MRRDARYHDAARLYCHQRVTVIAELARRCNLNPIRLGLVRRDDKWDEFVNNLAGKSMTSVFTRPPVIERSEEQVKLMKQEVADQVLLVEKLRTQRDRITAQLEGYTPGTKQYTGALQALAVVRREIEAMTGLDDAKAELSSFRGDRMKKVKGGESSAGEIVDLSLVPTP